MNRILSLATAVLAFQSCLAHLGSPLPANTVTFTEQEPSESSNYKAPYSRRVGQVSRRRLREINVIEIYNAAITPNSESTVTTYSKCRLPSGEVIVLGAKAAKSGSTKASKAPKASRAPTTSAPTSSTAAPSPAPVSRSTKSPKASKRAEKLTVNDLTTTSSKSSKSAKYDNADIPPCDPSVTPSTADSTCSAIRDGSLTLSNPVDEFYLYVTVGGEDINRLMNQGLEGILETQIRLALARLSGCSDEQLSRRHRRLAESVLVATSFEQVGAGGNGVTSSSTSSMPCDSNGSQCEQFISTVEVGGQRDDELYQQMRDAEDEVTSQCQAVFGDNVRFVHIIVSRLPLGEPNGGNGGSGGNGVGGVVEPEETSSSESKSLQAGGWVGLAGAFLVLLFLLLCIVKRRSNHDKSFYTSEEDSGHEPYYDDDESSVSRSPDRLAHVVGEENSQYTGTSWGNKSRIRIQPIESVPEDTMAESLEITQEALPEDEFGQSFESQRETAQFVTTETYDPSVSYERDYMASDTVDL